VHQCIVNSLIGNPATMSFSMWDCAWLQDFQFPNWKCISALLINKLEIQ
jgi:hypothetical protein